MTILIFINTIVFCLIASLHIYWAMGGKKYLNEAIPVDSNGKNAMKPSKAATLFVALILLLFATITIANFGFFSKTINEKYISSSTLFIGIIFIIRVIGDFKFVGITKRIKGTPFAIKDDKVYIPLCLLLSCTSIIIAIAGK
jgi:hypothetical protein